jgi:hypothetical protein
MTEESQAPTDGDLVNKPHAEVAAIIAERLGETEELPRKGIVQIVHAAGRTQAVALLEQTLQVEAAGGMMLPDGSRRRTPGGVYFHLAYTIGKSKSGKKLHRIGHKPAQPKPAQAGSPIVAQPTAPAFTWNDRIAAIEAIGTQRGKVTTVKITLIGTLGKYKEQGQCVVGVMQHAGEKFPALPKGVPAPQPVKTNYVVYISSKQFKNVAAAANDPEDALIIEGFPQIDGKTGAISVFASTVTSKKLQASKRQGQ